MKRNGLKMKLTLLMAAAAGFVAGKWGNADNKDRVAQRLKEKRVHKTRIISKSENEKSGEVVLDEYELLSFHN